MCSTWQVHKSPGWGDCDMARPWGPDALSTSTAEPATDASRPSQEATRSAWARSNVHKHIRMKNKESLPSITPPTLTSAAYTPPFPPFLLHIHSLVMTRTKDSWEGDGVSWEMTGDPFMTNAPPQCPRNCSLICHPRFLGTEKKGRIKKIHKIVLSMRHHAVWEAGVRDTKSKDYRSCWKRIRNSSKNGF